MQTCPREFWILRCSGNFDFAVVWFHFNRVWACSGSILCHLPSISLEVSLCKNRVISWHFDGHIYFLTVFIWGIVVYLKCGFQLTFLLKFLLTYLLTCWLTVLTFILTFSCAFLLMFNPPDPLDPFCKDYWIRNFIVFPQEILPLKGHISHPEGSHWSSAATEEGLERQESQRLWRRQ